MHIPGRKYEVELPDGRVVSRQRAHQILYPEKHLAQVTAWKRSEAGKASRKRTNAKYAGKAVKSERPN